MVDKLDTEHNSEKPCGENHPLPCGLDEWCPVSSEYFSVVKSDEEICEDAGL